MHFGRSLCNERNALQYLCRGTYSALLAAIALQGHSTPSITSMGGSDAPGARMMASEQRTLKRCIAGESGQPTSIYLTRYRERMPAESLGWVSDRPTGRSAGASASGLPTQPSSHRWTAHHNSCFSAFQNNRQGSDDERIGFGNYSAVSIEVVVRAAYQPGY